MNQTLDNNVLILLQVCLLLRYKIGEYSYLIFLPAYVLDAKLYLIEDRQNGNDLIPSIDKYLLLWVLGGILFLPTAIEAVLDLDSTLITDPTSLLTTYYNSLYDTSSSIATSITTLTTLVTTQYNDLVTGLITIMTTLTTIINTMTTISNSITTINTQITTITIGKTPQKTLNC